MSGFKLYDKIFLASVCLGFLMSLGGGVAHDIWGSNTAGYVAASGILVLCAGFVVCSVWRNCKS